MLFKRTPKESDAQLSDEEKSKLHYLVNAGKIVEVSENKTTDIQDYDLKLDNGLDVLLYVQNCNDRIPEVGDYFFVNYQNGIYLYSAEEFEAEYHIAEEFEAEYHIAE
jgi:hypothetical protein